MEFYEVVNKRRSVRKFQSKSVEADRLQRILDAGLKAPSHNHLREWEFILVKGLEQRAKVVEAGAKAEDVTDGKRLEKAVRGLSDDLQRKMYLKALPIQKRMLLSSPELLVVCFRMKKPLRECKTLYELNDFASVWTCIENVLLAMAAEGLYGVTYIPHETSSLKKILGVPDDYEVATLIPIGYPQESSVKQKQILLQEKTHYNEW
ncbi:MAG TPA: nitroreductase family protein [Candidatus Bathyarchaeia archaeon]|nr:nitroreductase family protein [Candidatus Bathyarchaeia archaeon]